MKRHWIGCVALAALCTLGAGGAVQGRTAPLTRTASPRADREARILAWIVERNPAATIEEFLTFPSVLLDESARAGIDYRLILAMADKESGMNPRAVGRGGEVWLLQLLPSTAHRVAQWLDDPRFEPPAAITDEDGRTRYSLLGSLADPKLNVRYGIAYLKRQTDQFGMTPAALRAYNRHPARTSEVWPEDRYAEDVALRYFTLVQRFE